MSVLYVTWDGPGARYLRSLYLPIFARLSEPVEVLQATYGESDEVVATRETAERLGVGYRSVLFPRGASTTATVARGGVLLGRSVARAVWEDRARLVMARSLVPAAAVMGVGLPRRRFIFDADGLVADERVEFGSWSRSGLPYAAARAVERRALRAAAVTLTRTARAADVLERRASLPRDSVVVAPNGSDESRFVCLSEDERRATRRRLRVPEDAAVVVYAGGIGPQYHPALMAHFVRSLRRHRPVFFLILSAHEEPASGALQLSGGVGVHRSVAPSDVPGLVGVADFALAFREPSFSQQAVSPVKVGEYLLAGVPVVTNPGVGDLDEMLDERVSVMTGLTEDEVERAACRAQQSVFSAEEIRAHGLAHFSLSTAVSGYQRALDLARARKP